MKSKSITERNQAWENASQQEKRVMICQDVIDYLDSSNIRILASTCYYGTMSDKKVTKESLVEDTTECVACARGAMMLSRFRFEGQNPELMLDPHSRQISDDSTTEVLKDVFTVHELLAIEGIFEHSSGRALHSGMFQYNHPGEVKNWWKILDSFPKDAKERLREIMHRIIVNEGDVKKALTCDEPEVVIPG